MDGFKGALWGVIISEVGGLILSMMSGLIEDIGVTRQVISYLGMFSMLLLACGVASLVLGVRSIKIFKSAFAECKPIATQVLGVISLILGILITISAVGILFAVVSV